MLRSPTRVNQERSPDKELAEEPHNQTVAAL